MPKNRQRKEGDVEFARYEVEVVKAGQGEEEGGGIEEE